MKRITGALICSIVWMMGALQTAEAQLNITLPDTSFEVSQSEFQLPISINGLAPDSILGYSITVQFDSAVTTMIGFNKTGTLSSSFSIVENFLSEGTYRVSGATTSPIYDDGVLLYLQMSVVGEGVSEVRFTDIEINEGEPAFTSTDGLVSIGNPPVVEVSSPLEAIELEEDFGNITIADLDTVFTSYSGDALSFEITSDTSEVIHSGIEGSQLTLTSLADVFGEAEIIIRAFTEDAEAFDTLNVSVLAVNDLPYFVDIPDTIQVRSGDSFTLDYGVLSQDVEDAFEGLTFEFVLTPDTLQLQVNAEEGLLTIVVPDYSGFGELTLRMTDSDGGTAEASIVVEILEATSGEREAGVPEAFKLHQNYPNPFNPTTVISYQLAGNSVVSLKVFDMLGREVATLVDGRKAAGEYQVSFDAAGLSSGMYIYRLQADGFMETRRMMLIK